MHLGRILDHHHVLALLASVAKLRNGRCGVGQQSLFVGGIGPSTRDDARAVPRADLVLVGVDQGIERRAIDQPFFNQQRFKRLDPQREVGGNGLMAVAMLMVLRLGEIVSTRGARSRQKTASSCVHSAAPFLGAQK